MRQKVRKSFPSYPPLSFAYAIEITISHHFPGKLTSFIAENLIPRGLSKLYHCARIQRCGIIEFLYPNKPKKDADKLWKEVWTIFENAEKSSNAIKAMKGCLRFRECKRRFTKQVDFNAAVKTLWDTFFGNVTEPDIGAIQDVIREDIPKAFAKDDPAEESYNLILDSVTQIHMVQPNGIEIWFVKDFEKGLSGSTWINAISTSYENALRLVLLKQMNVKIPNSVTSNVEVSWVKYGIDLIKEYFPGSLYFMFSSFRNTLVQF